ncbi:sugar transferase [Nocardioides sp. zg-536]|uniref:Sugar transferase n=1 Tax=Nocardioides faecalis TaxID=2803858 RepID=A0A938Y3Z1_9ACTN|nr:sugar transferase [Nocardioides faecalis]MBM9461446.1 sugar transferase [Nocardioides faecalis]QVI59365.1 sugar transferase [Nocardioides faecalis]
MAEPTGPGPGSEPSVRGGDSLAVRGVGSDWTSPEEVAARMVRSSDRPLSGTWRDRYVRYVRTGDVAGLVLAGAVATLVRYQRDGLVGVPEVDARYALISLGLVAVWALTLRWVGVYDRKVLVEGDEEYRLAARAAVLTFAVAASVATLVTFGLSRLYLAIFLGTGLLATLGTRKVLRTVLARRRLAGRSLNRVLVIGGARAARTMAASFAAHPAAGYHVQGVWWPTRSAHYGSVIEVAGNQVRSYGWDATLEEALEGVGADTVIVTDTELLGNEGLKALGWALQGSGIDLLLSPNVVDVAGPRVHVRAVANLPLLHLDEPQFAGAAQIGKVAFDKVVASVALLLASPLLLVTALAVRATSPGPVLYGSRRVGVGGREFRMLKFRTMVDGADGLVADLSHLDTGAGPLFKAKDDPRVTRVGRVLRRYSIDELPQLFNVLRGDMSLVGPRPPLPSEVAGWADGVERRLLVRQGMTGLWQVSGRSDLQWEDAVRLDLDYVENWSMTRDLQIIWRTVRAVLRSDGAY